MPTTANMSMILPTEGGDSDIWDTLINAALTLNDAHDHTTGKGVKIPSAALRINADVPWNDSGVYYAITGIKALDFQPQAAADMASYAGALFVSSADNNLYYRTTAGANVKLTDGAALNVTAFTGGIGGDYAAAGALVSYVDADDAYYFQQQGSPRPWARIRTGDVDIYETAASIANRIRLQSPAALAASYALTFAAALPASTVLVQVSSTGQLNFSNALANNADVTLSGTGVVKHGDYTLPVQVIHPDVVIGAGSAANNGALPGITVAVSSTVYIPIRGLPVGKRIKSISVRLGNTPAANVTYQLSTAAASGGAVAFTDVGASTSSAAQIPVVTPNGATGWPIGTSDVPFLKIVTPGGATSVPCLLDVVFFHN